MQRYVYNILPAGWPPDQEMQVLPAERPTDDIAAACRTIAPDDGREHLIAFAVDARGRTVGYQIIASGTVDACMLYPRDVFCWAMLVPTARYVGLAHNHPAGVVEPSPPDVKGTATVAAAGALVGLDLLWSIIFTHRSEAWQEVKLPRAPKMEGEDAQPKRPEEAEGEPQPAPQPAPGDGEDAGEGEDGEDADRPAEGDGAPQEAPAAGGGDEPDGQVGHAGGREGDASPVSIDDVRAAMKRLLKRAG